MRERLISLNILVAEDNHVNQLLMAAIFDGTGHMLTFANNGEEAVMAFEVNAFDLILMDIRMPIMDGFEASRQIRRRELPGEHCPIVAVTAQGLRPDAPEVRAAGIDALVAKPIDRPSLLSKLHEMFDLPTDLDHVHYQRR